MHAARLAAVMQDGGGGGGSTAPNYVTKWARAKHMVATNKEDVVMEMAMMETAIDLERKAHLAYQEVSNLANRSKGVWV